MGIEDLSQLEIIEGIFALIYIAVGTLTGTIIASKYAKYKRKELLFIGISLIFITIPQFAIGLTFITVVYFNYVLNDTVFFLIYRGFSAIGILSWTYGLSLLLFPKSRKKFVLSYFLICVIYEIFILVALFIDPSLVAIRLSKMRVQSTLIVNLFSLFAILTILITMLLFIRECFKSDNLKIIWKGRFLLISTVFLVIATIIGVLFLTYIPIIILSMILLIFRMIFSYFGWLLPDWVAKLLIKENK